MTGRKYQQIKLYNPATHSIIKPGGLQVLGNKSHGTASLKRLHSLSVGPTHKVTFFTDFRLHYYFTYCPDCTFLCHRLSRLHSYVMDFPDCTLLCHGWARLHSPCRLAITGKTANGFVAWTVELHDMDPVSQLPHPSCLNCQVNNHCFVILRTIFQVRSKQLKSFPSCNETLSIITDIICS